MTKKEIKELLEKVDTYIKKFNELHNNQLTEKDSIKLFKNLNYHFKLTDLTFEEQKIFTLYMLSKNNQFDLSKCNLLKSKKNDLSSGCESCSNDQCKQTFTSKERIDDLFKVFK